MSTTAPSTETLILIVVFSIIYILVVLRKTLHGKLDLYDLLMLSMVAIVPAVFTLFPKLSLLISQASGVAFPFVVMFGALFLIVFVFMHSMTVRLHKLERQNCKLIQELGLLSLSLVEAHRNQRENA